MGIGCAGGTISCIGGTGGCTGGTGGMTGGCWGAGSAGGQPSAMFAYNLNCAVEVCIPILTLPLI